MEDGSYVMVYRNPALLDSGVVATAWYTPDGRLVNEPNIAAAPSILAQIAGPVATVWASHELKRGLEDSGDTINVQGSNAKAQANATAEASAPVDVENINQAGNGPKNLWGN